MLRPTIETLLSNYTAILRRLDTERLSEQRDDDFLLSELYCDNTRFLGFYTESGLEYAARAYGIDALLRNLGYSKFRFEFDLSGPQQIVRLLADEKPFAELRARISYGLSEPCAHEFLKKFTPRMLAVDWFTLTHWKGEPLANATRLPGQYAARTGHSREFLVILTLIARRLGLHGIEQSPFYFHNAVMYHEKTRFLDPVFQGQFEAMLRVMPRYGLRKLSWGIERGELYNLDTGEDFKWTPHTQLYALSPYLKAYFLRTAWRAPRREARAFRFALRS